MTVLYLLLLLAAALCFGLATFNRLVFRKVNLVALGLLLWVLVPVLVTARDLVK